MPVLLLSRPSARSSGPHATRVITRDAFPGITCSDEVEIQLRGGCVLVAQVISLRRLRTDTRGMDG